MGAWGIKALERDEGLDVLDILKNEYVPEHPVMDLGEMIELMKEEVTGFTASKEALAFLLRQLTDIKNEVPDEDGIREIVDLWKNEDSGEIAPAWPEHLDWLIKRLISEQEA